MISCAHAAELISRSMETKLSGWQRVVLRVHFYGCDLCRRFRRQAHLVNEAGRRLGEAELTGGEEASLTPEARTRIQQAIAGAAVDGSN
jgi:hypothetical protein